MKEFYIDGYDVVEQFPDDTPNSVIQDTLNKAYPETDDQFYARIQAPSTLASSVSFEDFKRFKESKPDYTPSDYASMVAHGAGIAAKELTEAVKETISAASRGELGEIGLSLAEGAARGTYDLEMLGKRVSDNLNTIIEPYFQETGDAEQDQYNRFLAVKEMDNLRHAARQGDTTLLKRFGIEVDPSKINQGIAEGSSYLLDPTLLVGMPGASKVASILSKGAAKPFIKAGQVAGKSADLITDAETWVSRVAKQGMTKLDESTGGLGKYIVPGGVGATAAAAGLGPAAGTALAVAGAVPALRVAEGLLTGFGKSMLGYPTRNTALRSMALTQPGTIAGKMAGSLKFLDTPVEYAGRAAAGLVAGAGIGGGLGFAAGGLEGAAQGIGTGGVLGASVGGLSRFAEGMTGVNLRRAEDNDFRNWRSNQDDSTKAFLDTLVNRKDKIQVMDAIKLAQATVGDQASIRILDSNEFQKRFPGGKGVQVVEGDLPVAYIDSQKGDAETLFHEVFHAIARLDGFDAVTTKIGQDITDLYSIKEIHELMKDYESSGVKLLGETTAERFKSVTEELAADYFANLIKGKDSSYLFKGSTFGQSIRNTLSKVVAGKLDRMADTFTGTSFSNVQKKSKGIDRAINDLVKARREAHRDVTLSSGEPIKIYGENDLGNDKTFNALEAMGIAETDGKGRRVFRSQYRINKDSRAVTSELDKVLKGADSTDGLQLKDDGTWEGKRMSLSQVEAILRSGSIPDKVKEVVRYIQGTAGDVHNITYGAATYKTRSGKTRYRNLPISNRDGIIYGIEVSPKTGTMIARTLDLSLVNSKIKRLWGSDPRFAREFGTADKMYSDALRYIKALGGDIPTAQVLGSASKRNLLNRLLGIRNVKGNPEIVEGATIKEGDHPWRSFRLDRVVKMRHLKDVDSTFSKSAYEQGQRNFSPRTVVDVQSDLANAVNELGLKAKKYNVAEYFSKRSAELGKLDQLTPENAVELGNAIYDEATAAVAKDQDAVGWYDRKMDEAMGYIHELHPELKNDASLDSLMKAFIAITSNGQTVNDNFKRGEYLYNHYKKTGKILKNADWGGKSKHAINKGLSTLDVLVGDLGLRGAKDFMLKEISVKDLNAIMSKYGIKNSISGELGSQQVIGAMFMGPKIGSFFGNLNKRFDSITMDRWFMRTINRMRGVLTDPPVTGIKNQAQRLLLSMKGKKGITKIKSDLSQYIKDLDSGKTPSLEDYSSAFNFLKSTYRAVEKRSFKNRTEVEVAAQRLYLYASEINEAPSGGGERKWVRDAMSHAQRRLQEDGVNLTNADLQAVLWYWEKDLYQGFGVGNKRSERADYAEAARQLLGSRRRDTGAGRSGRAGSIPEDASTAKESNAHGDPSGQVRFSPGSPSSTKLVTGQDFIPETGKEFTFQYIRNTEKAPDMGSRFGQDTEPSGRYMQVGSPTKTPGMESGKISFKNPLVMDWGGGYGEVTNWKNVLRDRYNNKTGRSLSDAIREDGHDGIVTVSESRGQKYTSEIVDLQSNDIRFSPSRTLNNRGGAIYTTEQGHKAIQTSSRAGVRVYDSSGKRIGPVFASVERAERYLSK
jgi:hypothetical protein